MAEAESDDSPPETSSSSLARVRVYARVAGKERVAMIGLVPRSALEDVKKLQIEARGSSENHLRLAARVKRIESVRVTLGKGLEPVSGRYVLLGFSVQPGPARPSHRSRVLQRELEELMELAERVREVEPTA